MICQVFGGCDRRYATLIVLDPIAPGVSPPRLTRSILAMSVPALGAIAAEPIYNVVDTAIVGGLGRSALDALAVSATTVTVLGWLLGFLTTATTSSISAARGAGKTSVVRRSAGAAYAVALAVGIPAAAFLAIAAPWIATALGGGHAHEAAVAYMRWASLGVPWLFVSFAGTGHATGLSDIRTPLVIAVGANALNVALELVLVYPAGLGLDGSAIGTAVAQALAASAYAWYSWRRAAPGDRPVRPGRTEIRYLLRVGLELTIRTLALAAAPIGLTAAAARLGPAQLAGNQIAIQTWMLLSLLLDSLALPGQVFVSRALGADDRAGARRIGRRVLWLAAFAGLAVAAVNLAAAWVVPALLAPDPTVRHWAWLALLIGALIEPLAAGAFALDGLILGLGDYRSLRQAMVIALIEFGPLAAVGAAVHALGLWWLWAAYGSWLATRALLLERRWRAFERAEVAGYQKS